MRQLLVAAFVLACTHHAAALVAGPHSPAPAGMHPGHLALRGGGRGKKEEAQASPDTITLPTLKPPGRIAHLFKKMVNDLFDAVDTNKDGKVDRRPIACARRAARACLPSI